jgi:hypothetical protein
VSVIGMWRDEVVERSWRVLGELKVLRILC